MSAHLRIVPIGSNDTTVVASLFAGIAADPSSAGFHPHPFTAAEAARRVTYRGLDLYVVMACDDVPIGYGMLRGWDEGYSIPSLGIYIVPEYRGRGMSRALVNFLHAAARLRNASQVRLKVYAQNERARRLYESMGYSFECEPQDGQLIGYVTL
jgi:GNAT superfamily N-acetyltransferase